MKKSGVKNVLLAVSLGLGFNYAGLVAAHDISGSLSGFSGAGATDIYLAECTDSNNDHIEISVSDLTAGGALVNVQVYQYPLSAHATDNIGGDGSFSPVVELATNGASVGKAIVTVNQTAAASTNYLLRVHCNNAAGTELGGHFTEIQNQ